LCTATGGADEKYACSTTEEEQEVRTQGTDLAGADVNALPDPMAMPDGAEDAVAAAGQTYLQEGEESASVSTQTPVFGIHAFQRLESPEYSPVSNASGSDDSSDQTCRERCGSEDPEGARDPQRPRNSPCHRCGLRLELVCGIAGGTDVSGDPR
jgi:hypothetical protein